MNRRIEREARARVVEARREAASRRAERERANSAALVELVSHVVAADGVLPELEERIAALRFEARARREEHRLLAAAAVEELRGRGESVEEIAEQSGVPVAVVRELVRVARRRSVDGEAVAGEPEAVATPGDAAKADMDEMAAFAAEREAAEEPDVVAVMQTPSGRVCGELVMARSVGDVELVGVPEWRGALAAGAQR